MRTCSSWKIASTPPTFDDLSQHIEHWLDLGGERVLALGSDFDGCDPVPDIGERGCPPSKSTLSNASVPR